MTVRTLLSSLDIANHKSGAKYPDGSGGNDEFVLHIFLNGHGKLLNANVKQIVVSRGAAAITADGECGSRTRTLKRCSK